MALSFSLDGPATGPMITDHKTRVWTGSITTDNAYPTGGWAIAGSSLGMFNNILSLNVESFHSKYLFSWDQANQKLKAYIKQAKTSATAPADATTGAKLVDNTGTEVAGSWLGNAAASTAYDVINHAEAAASDANLNGIVIRVRAEGW